MMALGAGLLIFAPNAETMNVLGWLWPALLLALVVWLFVQARKSLRSRVGKGLLYAVFGALALSALGGGYASARGVLASSVIEMPGQLVEVGGHNLYLHCSGSGRPAVVLEAGLGGTSADWGRIAPAVAAETTVCVYDRAGRGLSEASSGLHDGAAITADLQAALEAAKVDAPYVLVGHSSGGVYVRIFASKYPEDVAGMVLLEAQPVEAFTGLPNYPGFYRWVKVMYTVLPLLARLGVGDVTTARSVRDEFVAHADFPATGSRADDPGRYAAHSRLGWHRETARLGPLPDQMVTLSSNSLHRVIPDATHSSLISDESDAAKASEAILDVVESVRTGTPLANS
jgi:pimeloyl-ACP methyl ester carboxylesterase